MHLRFDWPNADWWKLSLTRSMKSCSLLIGWHPGYFPWFLDTHLDPAQMRFMLTLYLWIWTPPIERYLSYRPKIRGKHYKRNTFYSGLELDRCTRGRPNPSKLSELLDTLQDKERKSSSFHLMTISFMKSKSTLIVS